MTSPVTHAPDSTRTGTASALSLRDTESFVSGTAKENETSWRINGDLTVLVDAARKLRLGIDVGIYRAHHTVVSGATEIARHVLDYLLPTVDTDACRR
jgi:hypothetical protein